MDANHRETSDERWKDDEENHRDMLTLSLSSFHYPSAAPPREPSPAPPPPPPPPPPVLPMPSAPRPPYSLQAAGPSLFLNQPLFAAEDSTTPVPPADSRSRARQARRKPSRTIGEHKSDTIPPPFAWATDRRATVHRLSYLLSNRITTISGRVQCKRCERQYEMEFDLEQKFREIASFVAENKDSMRHRAPREWQFPTLPRCRYCENDNSVKPVISDKKRTINWLFMFLGQMLGCCTLEQLKYFCKHTKNHRTGAKNRVLYLTYLGLCKQLEPNGPFDI